ncbi:hypothetical protein RO575_08310 [Methylomonas sp. MO1]|uniref:AbrB/MazE/SpoVT family DNA-binding domain-containing protein n=1 Tax=Methylomonas sp. MO1 TaxID=3073619 RepID=UPI0028A557F5|nr:hypothetical protein [Methylomonas sp. MO1]MDT4289559.1 hypothetical protein [Methylomonas sp. MO1]
MKKFPNAAKKIKNNYSKRRYTLTQLLGRITPQNKHSEFGWGTPIGKEIIE